MHAIDYARILLGVCHYELVLYLVSFNPPPTHTHTLTAHTHTHTHTHTLPAHKHTKQSLQASQLIQLRADIAQRGQEIQDVIARRAKAIDDCDGLRDEIAALHARRPDAVGAVNSTITTRVDLQVGFTTINKYL